jgi:iron-sulfur cluster repair protein YtfE (RIC family)
MFGGVAVGIIGSRILPPIFAQVVGAIRGRRGVDPFERLVHEHERIAAVLQEMENATEVSIAERTRLLLTLKRLLSKHSMAEEDIVYPLLHDEAGDAEGSMRLYSEHADMKIHLYEIEQLIKRDEPWNARVRSLRELILSHVHEEEEVVFPKLRRALDSQRTAQLSQYIGREEALIL